MGEGFLIVDKPKGITSHDVVSATRRALQMKRVGHAGTLDPLATGVLVVGIGRATRLIEYIVGQPKTYTTTIRLGQATNTYDADGEIVSECPVPSIIDEERIKTMLESFTGDILQVPPMYSAIKKDGQPLYKLARQGIEIERPARPVTIYRLDLLSWDGTDLQLEIDCSTGTYIRSLAHDLGKKLGCGGHVTVLRRTRIGKFYESDAVELAEIGSSLLMPTDVAVEHLPYLNVDDDDERDLRHGKMIGRQATHPDVVDESLVRVYTPEDAFLGILQRCGEEWKPHKMFT